MGIGLEIRIEFISSSWKCFRSDSQDLIYCCFIKNWILDVLILYLMSGFWYRDPFVRGKLFFELLPWIVPRLWSTFSFFLLRLAPVGITDFLNRMLEVSSRYWLWVASIFKTVREVLREVSLVSHSYIASLFPLSHPKDDWTTPGGQYCNKR